MAKVPKPKTLLFHPLLWTKMLCLIRSNWFQPRIWLIQGHSNTQVSQPICKSLGSYFLSWNWKSMWKSYSEHFLFFEIFWLLLIFGTLFSKKCPFLGNFYKKKTIFARIINTNNQKWIQIQFRIVFMAFFVHMCRWWEQKYAFVKIAQKWTFFTK